MAPCISVPLGWPRNEQVALEATPAQMLYSLMPPVSLATCWPTPDGDAEAKLLKDWATPAPVSTNPMSTEEPAINLTDRLSFDLRLLNATAGSPFEL